LNIVAVTNFCTENEAGVTNDKRNTLRIAAFRDSRYFPDCFSHVFVRVQVIRGEIAKRIKYHHAADVAVIASALTWNARR
jgi:hypothetical protein